MARLYIKMLDTTALIQTSVPESRMADVEANLDRRSDRMYLVPTNTATRTKIWLQGVIWYEIS